MHQNNRQISFQQVLTALLDGETPFPPKYLHRFSDIAPEDMAELKKVWPQVSGERRANLLADLEELAELDTLVSFDDIGRFALQDNDPGVLVNAIRLLWECEDPKLIPIFIRLMEKEDDEMVRASAAMALGLFVYLGELEEIPLEIFELVVDRLYSRLMSEDAPIVRRRTLESLGYSSRAEIQSQIQNAYESKDLEWIASALFAMGRSADARWEKLVLATLDHPDLNVQIEAVRAAGQLELSSARKKLLKILKNHDQIDEDVKAAAIWSLSQIGGERVRDVLETMLEESEDEDEIDYLEKALENLEFTDGFREFSMYEFDMPDEDDFNPVENLPDDEEDD